MRTQFFPDVVLDSVTVSVTWEGASAEDIDRAIVQVLDPVLIAVEGVESAEATSREGQASDLRSNSRPSWDMARADR